MQPNSALDLNLVESFSKKRYVDALKYALATAYLIKVCLGWQSKVRI